MDIKDFIKVADAYGKVDQEDKQQVQEGLLDWFKDKLGLSDEEAQAATDAAAEAGANTDTTPEVDPDANDPRTGNNDSGARGEPREPAEVPPGGAGVSGQAQAAAGTNAAEPEAEPEAAPDTDNAQIPGEPDTFQRDTGAGGADPAGTGSVDDPANQNLDQRGTREPEDTRDLMTRYNEGGKKAMPEVEQLQRDLEELGFDPNGIDGKYGRGTYAAVQAFQKANGLQVDGQAGPNTLAKIQELKGGSAAASPDAADTAQQTGGTGATASGDQGDGNRGADSADNTAEPAAQTAGPDDGTRGGQTTPDYSNMSDEEAQNTINTASPDLISQLSPAERRALQQLQQANDRGVDQLPRDF